MSTIGGPNWASIRERSRAFPDAAFEFVREGLTFTVDRRELESLTAGGAGSAGSRVKASNVTAPVQVPSQPGAARTDSVELGAGSAGVASPDGSVGGADVGAGRGSAGRHVTGVELSLGLRDFALARYGLLAGAVLRRWGFRRTDDFGVVVYAMIDRGEMRASAEDNLEDFHEVFDFDAVFGAACGSRG